MTSHYVCACWGQLVSFPCSVPIPRVGNETTKSFTRSWRQWWPVRKQCSKVYKAKKRRQSMKHRPCHKNDLLKSELQQTIEERAALQQVIAKLRRWVWSLSHSHSGADIFQWWWWGVVFIGLVLVKCTQLWLWGKKIFLIKYRLISRLRSSPSPGSLRRGKRAW